MHIARLVIFLVVVYVGGQRWNQSCLTKMNGYFWDEQQCIRCRSPRCKCVEYDGCDSCVDYYYLANGVCQACPKGCLACCPLQRITEIICTLCEEGFFNLNGVCFQIQGCSSFSRHGRCDICLDGYYLEDVCQPCPEGCRTCNSSHYCTDCISGYYPVIKDNTYTCKSCSTVENQGCNTCTDDLTCLSCLGSYFFDKDTAKCLKCMPKCRSCQNPLMQPPVCFSCESGYLLADGQTKCISCQQSIPHCLWCTQKIFEGNAVFQCEECQNGYYRAGGTCASCKTSDSNARRCNSVSEITQCEPGYLLFDDAEKKKCIENTRNCRRIDNANGSCQSCMGKQMVPKDSGNNVFSCVACGEFIPNCKACSFGNSIYSCIDCEESYYTYRGLCIKCQPNCSQCTESSCTLCESGYFLLNGQCLDCNVENCVECAQAGVCTGCVAQYGLIKNKCEPCLFGCDQCDSDIKICRVCTEGFYLQYGACVKYMDHCKKSNHEGYCILCETQIFHNSLEDEFIDEVAGQEIDEIEAEEEDNQEQEGSKQKKRRRLSENEKESIFYKVLNGHCVKCSDYHTGSFTCPYQCMAPIEERSRMTLVALVLYYAFL